MNLKRFAKEDLPKEMLAEYLIQSRTSPNACNTDKTNVFYCDMKCKTRGIQIACNNCGIVFAVRELFGSKSLTEVALMYLDLVDNYKGNFLFL
jgi:transcription elongation factor Elf1